MRVPMLTVSSLSGKSRETAVLKVTPRASTARDKGQGRQSPHISPQAGSRQAGRRQHPLTGQREPPSVSIYRVKGNGDQQDA